MRILDRYITQSIIGIFLGAVITFAFLFILIDSFSNLEDFIEKKVAISTILQYYLSYLPIIFVQTSPMALLIASMFTYSHLNTHNEIVAIRASGLNFWQVAKPALFFALFISFIVFWVNEQFVPKSSLITQDIKQSQIKVTIVDKNAGQALIKNLSFYGLKNRLFFIDTFNPNTNELTGITVIGHDQDQNLTEKVVALKGTWTGIAWKFVNVQTTSYDPLHSNQPLQVKIADEKLMDIKETPKDFIRQRLNINAMNIKQLHAYIKLFSNSGAVKTINNLRVDFWQKTAFPFRNFVIVLLGLPLVLMSVGKRRAATFTSIAIALVIGFLYYVIDAVGLALGKGGAITPPLSAWIAPLLFLLSGLAVIWKKF